MSESITDLLREEALIIEAEGATGESVDLLIDAANEITTLRQQLAESEARVAELLTICQAVQRDLLLRAEPDWDGSGQKVVNLSAGFWEELNRVIGKYDDTACKSFDAVILRKQAEAVEAVADKLEGMDLMYPDEFLRSNAQRLRQQADEAERAGGDK